MAGTTSRRATGAQARVTAVKKAARPAAKSAKPAAKTAKQAAKAVKPAAKAATPVKKAAKPAAKAAQTPAKAAKPAAKTAKQAPKESKPVVKAARAVPAKKVLAKTPPSTPDVRLPDSEGIAPTASPTTGRNIHQRVLIGAAVGLVVLLLAGIASFALRDPAPSKASYIAKADLICGPGNGPVTAIVRPTSYPELSTASATVVTATSAEVVQLKHLRRPAGENGKQADAAIKALAAYRGAAVTLRDAAVKKDDAATIAGTNSLKAAFADAKTKATAFGFTACGAGMQPGVETTLAGSTAVIKTAFTAKADSLCRAAATKMDSLPATPETDAGVITDINNVLAITQKLVTDMRALPAAPGDEPVVSQMLDAAEKMNAKTAELRDAISATDYARADAIIKEVGPLGTDSDHQFDAYGLRACGSNFGA